jgi:hypothetical protein
MLNETALAQVCTELAREGKNFLTIWATKLKRHALTLRPGLLRRAVRRRQHCHHGRVMEAIGHRSWGHDNDQQ